MAELTVIELTRKLMELPPEGNICVSAVAAIRNDDDKFIRIEEVSLCLESENLDDPDLILHVFRKAPEKVIKTVERL